MEKQKNEEQRAQSHEKSETRAGARSASGGRTQTGEGFALTRRFWWGLCSVKTRDSAL